MAKVGKYPYTPLVSISQIHLSFGFRFHEKVQDSLQARKADVVELYQPMSTLMQQIQGAVIECMEATLGELKRSCTNVRSTLRDAAIRS
jgi:hypothetical protein